MYSFLIKNGFDVKPLSKGSLKGVPFNKGDGFKVNRGGDRILQYHPAKIAIMEAHILKYLQVKQVRLE